MQKFLFSLLLLLSGYSLSAQTAMPPNLQGVSTLALPYTDSISSPHTLTLPPLSEAEWNSLQFDKLEAYQPNFRYTLLGRIPFQKGTLLLVERSYTEENIHWLCWMDSRYQLSHWIQTAYDNAEGFLLKRAQISERQVVVTEWNDYAEISPSSTTYLLTPTGAKEKE